jgi:poly-gamma-glutamate capsule biosynthesis protein CapA/YwtB (metallophosphatase superfamily)
VQKTPITTIAVAGDVVPSRYLADVEPNTSEAARAVIARLNSAETTFCSLEMPLSARGYPREKLVAFRSDLDLAPDLVTMGFTVVSLANNHSMDHGEPALLDTLEALGRNSLLVVGAGANLQDAESLVIREVAGVRIGFLAWTCLLPLGAAASAVRPGVAPLHIEASYEVIAGAQQEEPGTPPTVHTWPNAADLAHVQKVIASAKPNVDFLAVSVHIGYGSGEEMAEYERLVTHAMVDAGADIILGNHVHTLHGVEVYSGKVIIYSQGNFVAQQPRNGASDLAIKILDEMSKEGVFATVSLFADSTYSVDLEPIVNGGDGLPGFAEPGLAATISDRLVRLSAELGAVPARRDAKRVSFDGTW